MKRKKHILIIVENLPVPFDQRVWKEALALKDYYDVSVICPKRKDYMQSIEYKESIRIYRHFLPKERESAWGFILEYMTAFFMEFFLSLKLYLHKPFHVIHACNPPDNIFLIGIFFKMFGAKFIYDHHDLAPEQFISKFSKKGIFYKILLGLEKYSFLSSDVSLATNNSYKNLALQRGMADADKIFVVRNGPELDKIKTGESRDALEQNGRFSVCYVGMMGSHDGTLDLLDMIQYIVNEKKRRDIHFVCVGGGPSLNQIKLSANEMNLQQYIDFTGIVPHKKVLEIIGQSDVCIDFEKNTFHSEKSTMMKIMEYMALKKPIVQFDFEEGRYSAQESSLYAGKGDYKDFAERILYLLDNPELRKKMGDCGYNRIKHELDWKYSVPNLLKAYKTALS
jgi:glycosyltransferase involved in cell wall biosynthesis